jgi:outer membrane immunogenic protein
MKSKLLIAVAFIALSVLPAAAQGPYVGASGGLFIPHESDITITGLGSANVEYDVGGGFNINAGYDFNGFRLDAEFGYKAADIDKISGPGGSVSVSGADITVLSYMVNGFYDFKINSPVKPYLGVGIGILNGELDDNGISSDDTVFGYQVTAGIAYPMNKNLSFDLFYRLQGAPKDFDVDGTKLSYTSSNINLGLRYNF